MLPTPPNESFHHTKAHAATKSKQMTAIDKTQVIHSMPVVAKLGMLNFVKPLLSLPQMSKWHCYDAAIL